MDLLVSAASKKSSIEATSKYEGAGKAEQSAATNTVVEDSKAGHPTVESHGISKPPDSSEPASTSAEIAKDESNIMKVEVSSGEQSAVSAKSQLSTESKKAETKEAPPSQKSTSAIAETREETNTEKEKEEANNEEEKQEGQNQEEKEEANIDKKKNETKQYKKKNDKKDYKKKNDKKDYTKKEAAKEKQKKEDANESKTDDNAEDDEKTRKRKKVAGEPKYPLFTVVYKLFIDQWYFGYVESSHADQNWYSVRYEDGDQEDLDEDEMDQLVVKFENGDIARASPTPPNENTSERKPATTSGTADIGSYDDHYKSLDRQALKRYIDKRISDLERQQVKEAKIVKKKSSKIAKKKSSKIAKKSRKTKKVEVEKKSSRPFPSCGLGTIVYKFFGPDWFFGYVGRIDMEMKLYGIKYEDGDKEEINEAELSKIIVRRDNGIIAMTTTKPTQVELEEWENSLDFKEIASPGTIEVLSDELYSSLDQAFLTSYIRKRHADHKQSERTKSRRRLQSPPPKSSAKRIRAADKESPKRAQPRTSGSASSFFNRATGKLTENVGEFFRFMHERQSIWVRRKNSQYLTWTKADGGGDDKVLSYDETLRTYHFCNIYRELDRGTAFFHAHVLKLREAKKEWSDQEWLETVLWATYVYRQVNRVETFTEIGIPSMDQVSDFKVKAEKYGETASFFTGAHQTTTFGAYLTGLRAMSRTDGLLLKQTANKLLAATTVIECLVILESLRGIAEFMGWQLFCDLRECGCLTHCAGDDFCRLGPGAQKGLDVIFRGGKFRDYLGEAQKLVSIQDEAFSHLGLEFPYWHGRKLTIKEIEHALCEYNRYVSLKTKKISSQKRRYYKPRSDLGEVEEKTQLLAKLVKPSPSEKTVAQPTGDAGMSEAKPTPTTTNDAEQAGHDIAKEGKQADIKSDSRDSASNVTGTADKGKSGDKDKAIASTGPSGTESSAVTGAQDPKQAGHDKVQEGKQPELTSDAIDSVSNGTRPADKGKSEVRDKEADSGGPSDSTKSSAVTEKKDD